MLPSHPDSHDKRHFATEYGSFFGTEKVTTQDLVKQMERTNKQAGTYTRPAEEQGTKIISNMVGEIYNK